MIVEEIQEEYVEIPLTNGGVTLVSEGDAAWVNEWKWKEIVFGRGKTFEKRYVGRYLKRSATRRGDLLLHRAMLGLYDPKLQADHIDGNGLNNCRSNLRICDQKSNNRNIGIPNHNTSGFKGVHYHKRDLVYSAHIRVDRILKSLGSFKTPEEAARVYDAASILYHGEFGVTNAQLGLI